MTRKSTSNGAAHDDDPAAQSMSAEQIIALLNIGSQSNIPDDKMRAFQAKYRTAKAKIDKARGELGAICKQGEEEGIDLAAFKFTEKLLGMSAPEAKSRLQTSLRMGVQLGLFAGFEQNAQDEANSANAASVNAAENANSKKGGAMAAGDAQALEESAGKLTTASEQGLRAGLDGAKAKDNPYDKKTHPTEREYWLAQFKVGVEQAKSVAGAPARPVGSDPVSQPADT